MSITELKLKTKSNQIRIQKVWNDALKYGVNNAVRIVVVSIK